MVRKPQLPMVYPSIHPSIYSFSIHLFMYVCMYLSSICHLSMTCHLSMCLSSHHFCRLITAVLGPLIRLLPGVSCRPSPVYGHHKMSVDSPTADFPGSFSTVWRIRKKKNLSAGEIKPFFFRGEKWSSRLFTLKCYSRFQMNEKLVCIVMRLGRDLEGL